MVYYDLDYWGFWLDRSSFRNVVCFLEYQTMDRIQKVSGPDDKTTEGFRDLSK
jgi:hypothetical protein